MRAAKVPKRPDKIPLLHDRGCRSCSEYRASRGCSLLHEFTRGTDTRWGLGCGEMWRRHKQRRTPRRDAETRALTGAPEDVEKCNRAETCTGEFDGPRFLVPEALPPAEGCIMSVTWRRRGEHVVHAAASRNFISARNAPRFSSLYHSFPLFRCLYSECT